MIISVSSVAKVTKLNMAVATTTLTAYDAVDCFTTFLLRWETSSFDSSAASTELMFEVTLHKLLDQYIVVLVTMTFDDF